MASNTVLGYSKPVKLRTIVALVVLSLFCASPRAEALGRTPRTLLVTAFWGLAAGTIAGAITYPFHHSLKGVFVGSAVGLYTGLAVGTYYVLDHDNPGNPLRSGPLYRSQERLVGLRVPVLSF